MMFGYHSLHRAIIDLIGLSSVLLCAAMEYVKAGLGCPGCITLLSVVFGLSSAVFECYLLLRRPGGAVMNFNEITVLSW